MSVPSGGTGVDRPHEPLVRGFLFADLRGYTAYVERTGDAAAARLLARYRHIVRRIVESHHGAEIRTEGDSFFVVFPSPSAALRAGSALVLEAEADAADHPDDPIKVGVGIHAGESEETAEGFVGLAINIAARICALAGPNEVLVSETVRVLTRSSLAVRFQSRGRRSLKGVAEPIEVFRVDPSDVSQSTTTRSRGGGSHSRAVAAGLAAVALVVIVIVGGSAAILGRSTAAGSTPPTSGSGESLNVAEASAPSPSSPTAFRTGPLAAGTYRTSTFTPPVGLTVPSGWDGLIELPNFLAIGPLGDPAREGSAITYAVGARIVILRPSIAYVPCTVLDQSIAYPPEAIKVLGPSRDDLIAWLQADRGITLTGARAISLGFADALSFDARSSGDCPSKVATQALLAIRSSATDVDNIARRDFGLRAGETQRLLITEVGGQPILIAIAAGNGDLDSFSRTAMSVLSSLKPIP